MHDIKVVSIKLGIKSSKNTPDMKAEVIIEIYTYV